MTRSLQGSFKDQTKIFDVWENFEANKERKCEKDLIKFPSQLLGHPWKFTRDANLKKKKIFAHFPCSETEEKGLWEWEWQTRSLCFHIAMNDVLFKKRISWCSIHLDPNHQRNSWSAYRFPPTRGAAFCCFWVGFDFCFDGATFAFLSAVLAFFCSLAALKEIKWNVTKPVVVCTCACDVS